MSWVKVKKTAKDMKKLSAQDESGREFFIECEDDRYMYVPRCFQPIHPIPQLEPGQAMSQEVLFAGHLEDTAIRPQKAAVAAIKKAFSSWPFAGIVQLPPGCGKTVIAIASAIQLRQRTMICVHTSILFAQWLKRIATFAPNAKIGKIRGAVWQVDEDTDFIVAMLPTLYKKLDKPDMGARLDHLKCGLVVVDEVHHVAARTYFAAVINIPTFCLMGLSATPKRTDQLTRILYYVMGPSIFQAGGAVDTNLQKIARILHYRPCLDNSMTFSTHHQERAYYLRRLSRDSGRNLWLRDEIIKLLADERKQILILSHYLKHLSLLKALLAEHCDSIAIISQKTKPRERETIFAESRVICATYVLVKEGCDEARLNTMVLTLPAGNIIQTAGRVMRGSSSFAFVLDVVDEDTPFTILRNMAMNRRNFFQKNEFTIQDCEYKFEDHGLVPVRKRYAPPALTEEKRVEDPDDDFMPVSRLQKRKRASQEESKEYADSG
jgi:superfamily II DNA or RNA helicase